MPHRKSTGGSQLHSTLVPYLASRVIGLVGAETWHDMNVQGIGVL